MGIREGRRSSNQLPRRADGNAPAFRSSLPDRFGPNFGPKRGWQAFLRNHTTDIAGIDLFVVPTIGFKLLYGLVILGLERRRLVWTNVTANPTAEWIAQQISEAFPWDEAPRHLIRDRDTSYGAAVIRRL